jgi:ribosome-associated toxin RatA of RatAB toxin-antitoxin module
MAQTEYKTVVAVSREKFFQAIARYEDYPKFVDGCKDVQVERHGNGEARATYKMNIVRELSYILDHREIPDQGRLEWKLVSSDLLKKNVGSWTLKEVGPGKTEVLYQIEIEFNIPVPSFVLGPLVKSSIPTMIKGFEKQAKAL